VTRCLKLASRIVQVAFMTATLTAAIVATAQGCPLKVMKWTIADQGGRFHEDEAAHYSVDIWFENVSNQTITRASFASRGVDAIGNTTLLRIFRWNGKVKPGEKRRAPFGVDFAGSLRFSNVMVFFTKSDKGEQWEQAGYEGYDRYEGFIP